MLADFWAGLSYLGTAGYWYGFLVAVFITVPIALIPGISATLVMAIMIPFIVISVDDPVIGLVMLAVLTGIDNTLDSIPSILLGMPGGATQVTFLEGNQLAQRGEAAHTLGAVYAVSAIGGVVGALALAVIIPVIAPFVLKFGFAEIAAMAIFGVAMVAALSGGAMIKGMFAACLGMLLGTVGPGKVSLDFRYMFEQQWLWEGLPLIATTIGVFALPEIIDLTMTRKPLAPKDARISYGEIFKGARYGFARWPMAIRQSLFGVFLGAVPGIGSGVVDWMSYAFGIFWTKDKTQFGKGSLDGVLFAESAQNSKEGGQAVPTLALGIPGGRAWAFVILAMLSYGIAPGPRMLEDHADITIMIIVSLGLGNLMVTMLGLGFTRQMARLTLIPYPVLGFLIIPISLLAAFQDTRGRERYRHRPCRRGAGDAHEAVSLAAPAAAHRLHPRPHHRVQHHELGRTIRLGGHFHAPAVYRAPRDRHPHRRPLCEVHERRVWDTGDGRRDRVGGRQADAGWRGPRHHRAIDEPRLAVARGTVVHCRDDPDHGLRHLGGAELLVLRQVVPAQPCRVRHRLSAPCSSSVKDLARKRARSWTSASAAVAWKAPAQRASSSSPCWASCCS